MRFFRKLFISCFSLLLICNASLAQGIDEGLGDANNDGKTDFLLRHEGFPGTWYIAYMNGPNPTKIEQLNGLPLGDGFTVERIGDFNGDGYGDVILRDGLNNFYLYLIKNGKVIGSSTLPLPLLPYWTIKAVRDFDGDKKDDFILYNQATGEMRLCYMDGLRLRTTWDGCKKITGFPAYYSGNYFGTEIKTAGAYEGPGSLIFLADRINASTFKIERWYYKLNLFSLQLTGTLHSSLENIADYTWVPLGSQDFDKDGKPELIMSNNLTTEWMVVKLNGKSVVKTTSLWYAYSWESAGAAGLATDLWGDGRKAIISRYPGLNYYYYSVFDGSKVVAEGYLNLPPLPAARKIVGVFNPKRQTN